MALIIIACTHSSLTQASSKNFFSKLTNTKTKDIFLYIFTFISKFSKLFQVVSILLNKSSFYFNCFPPPTSSFSSVLIKYNSTGSHHLILLFDDIRLKSLPYQKQIKTKCFYEEKAQICGPLTCFLLMSPAGVG